MAEILGSCDLLDMPEGGVRHDLSVEARGMHVSGKVDRLASTGTIAPVAKESISQPGPHPATAASGGLI
jgi:hypothetical protein